MTGRISEPSPPNPRLSILVPAHSYSEGVLRALSQFAPYSSDQCEVIVFDDSPDEGIGFAIRQWSRESGFAVAYTHNRPPLGAVNNWNALIHQSRGDYCLLMHHDEFPISPNFVTSILKVLEHQKDTSDVIVMKCLLTDLRGTIMRPHLPRTIQNVILHYAPNYLLRRNVIGPASCLIVRRELYPVFDVRLKWLVDIDAYFRLRQATRRWHLCNGLEIGSVFKRDASITASIEHERKRIEAAERRILKSKYPYAKSWIDAKKHTVHYSIENAIWISMRLATRLLYYLRSKS